MDIYNHMIEETTRTDLTRTLQYAAAALAPIALGLETLRTLQTQYLHEETPLNALITVGLVLVILVLADRFANHFVPDGDHRPVAHALLFLLLAEGSVARALKWRDAETSSEQPVQQPVQQMGPPLPSLPREPTTMTGGDIRAPPSVGPGQQPNFNDMYGGFEAPMSGAMPGVEAFGGW
jgi:hypothetical protein